MLITTTPDFQGRSFGTNVVEAALIALLGKHWEDVTGADYERVLHELHLRPRVVDLSLNLARGICRARCVLFDISVLAQRIDGARLFARVDDGADRRVRRDSVRRSR